MTLTEIFTHSVIQNQAKVISLQVSPLDKASHLLMHNHPVLSAYALH